MKKIGLYGLCVSTIFAFQLCYTMSPKDALNNFVFDNLDKITQYQPLTQGTVNGTPIFDIVFSQIQQKKSNNDIYQILVNRNPLFIYNNSQLSIATYQNLLINNITGFIDSIKNQQTMFYILQKGIVAYQNLIEAQNKEKPLPTLITTNMLIQSTQAEFVIELDFYIRKYIEDRPVDAKLTWKTFSDWLDESDQTMIKNNYEDWIKAFNSKTHDQKVSPTIIYSIKDFTFFITSYIPQMVLSQNPTKKSVTWQDLAKTFPAFIIYEDKNLFRYSDKNSFEKTVTLLVTMINEHLKTMSNDLKI